MRRSVCLLSLFLLALPAFAQEEDSKHSTFGCSQGAVQIALDKEPALRFTPVDRKSLDLPGYAEGHKFVFKGEGPFPFVTVYLTATLPEASVGMSSTAQLTVYVQTAKSADEYNGGRDAQWWRLEPVPGTNTSPLDKPSASLTFQASDIGGCFNWTDGAKCSFANVALATPDADVPIISIGFTENEGGANAANWTESRLLLDFRTSPPKVAVTADCSYNEGGGACTAFDSGEMARAKLECDWKGEERDFLCSEETAPDKGGHSDFFLLGDKPAPLRSDEVASLGDALTGFKTKGHSTPVKVRGIGPVVWIDEVDAGEHKSVVVLASNEAFYFLPANGGKASSTVTIYSRPFLEAERIKREFETKADAQRTEWTSDIGLTASSRTVYHDRQLTVLQAVTKDVQGLPGLYWIGIESRTAAPAFDVVQLAGFANYAGCARSTIQATAVTVEPFSKILEAAVKIQPATTGSEVEDDIAWAGETNDQTDQEAVNCLRKGKIQWQDHKFQASMNADACAAAEKPRGVQINENGTVTLVDAGKP